MTGLWRWACQPACASQLLPLELLRRRSVALRARPGKPCACHLGQVLEGPIGQVGVDAFIIATWNCLGVPPAYIGFRSDCSNPTKKTRGPGLRCAACQTCARMHPPRRQQPQRQDQATRSALRSLPNMPLELFEREEDLVRQASTDTAEPLCEPGCRCAECLDGSYGSDLLEPCSIAACLRIKHERNH